MLIVEQEYRLAGQLHESSCGYHLGAFLLEHGEDDEAAQVLELAAYWGDLDARIAPLVAWRAGWSA